MNAEVPPVLWSRAMSFALLRAMRPKQWVKNLFILAPLVFSKKLFDADASIASAIAFLLFCATSSAVYLLNDIADREKDRAHPQKRFRPIASGELSITAARRAALILLVGALGAAALYAPALALILAGYLTLNFAYTHKLREIPYLDVLCIAGGFELRVLGGAAAADIPASGHLLVATFFLASFLGLGKRMHELLEVSDAERRSVLSRYDRRGLRYALIVFGLVPIAVYLSYTLSAETRALIDSPQLPLTTVFPIFGVARFMMLITSGHEYESPTEAMLHDAPFLLNFVLWAGFMLALLYAF